MRVAFSEPVVSAAGAGGERVFSAEAQAVGTSTGSEPPNAADTQALLLLGLAYSLYRLRPCSF
jgi:hypothetical protein